MAKAVEAVYNADDQGDNENENCINNQFVKGGVKQQIGNGQFQDRLHNAADHIVQAKVIHAQHIQNKAGGIQRNGHNQNCAEIQ